jgi:peptide deformylase
MAILNIIRTPTNEVLRKKAHTVAKTDKFVQTLLNDLTDTLNHEGGLGLAAPQIGTLMRLFVVRSGMNSIKFVNPMMVETDGEQISIEACLSLPGVYGKVRRPARVVVKALNEHGNPFELEAFGQLACALCHETDHLDGILFTDRAYLVRRMAQAKLPDIRRPTE